jgi:hypothetical protein
MAPVSFLVGLISFVVFILIFLTVGRLIPSIGWLGLELFFGNICYIVGAIAGLWLIDNFSIWYFLSLFAFCWFCFFFVSGIFYVSVSVGIIYFLNQCPDRSASIEEVYQECIVKQFYNRIDFMVRSGLVDHSQSGYFISKVGKSNVNRIQLIKKILKLETTGYYSSNKQ